jgi:hypothetical protein
VVVSVFRSQFNLCLVNAPVTHLSMLLASPSESAGQRIDDELREPFSMGLKESLLLLNGADLVCHTTHGGC